MNRYFLCVAAVLFYFNAIHAQQKSAPLFDGRSFRGWAGDTTKTWKIIDHTIAGGSLTETVPHNEFLATTERFGDFELELDFKLEGTGFVNAGVQFHSERAINPEYEMIGYQADLGDGYWASLYDESRRNVTIVNPDSATITRLLHRNAWNKFKIKSVGRRIQIWLNDTQTVDYQEPDEKIVHRGIIALQIHGGGKALASYRNIQIVRL
jgi:hypothetical protein